MKVLVTGATGFLGSHLVRRLVERGDRVVVLKRSGSDLIRIRQIIDAVDLYNADQDELDRLLAEHRDLTAVLHTATCYGRNGESEDVILEANTAFPLRLLQRAARARIPLFLHTDTCLNSSPLRQPYWRSYALSKRQFAEWGKHFGSRGDIAFLNVKLQHPYGPGDGPDKFVSSILRQCLDKVAEIRLTPGEQKKDFIYIEDVVSALLLLLERGAADASFREYDCGSGEAVSIRQFVETAHALIGSRTRLAFGALPYRDHEIMYSCADTAALNALGWIPRYGLREGLEQTLRADYGFEATGPVKAKDHATAVR